MLLLIAMLCQELTPYTDLPRPALPSPSGADTCRNIVFDGPVALNIDSAAVHTVSSTAENVSPRRVVVYMMPIGNCPPCHAMKADVGPGDSDIAVEYTTENPPFQITGYPTVYMPELNQVWRGKATLRNLRYWHGLPMEPVPQGPLMAGTASLGSISVYLDLITSGTLSGTLPREPIDVGSGASVNMNGAAWTLNVNGRTKSITFQKPEPYLQYAFVKATLLGVDYDGASLTLRLKNLPDWKFKVN